jgi:hypothetical protein
MKQSKKHLIIITEPEWRNLSEKHLSSARIFTSGPRHRKDRSLRHTVQDFLFDYYPYPFSIIENWHPGHHFALQFSDLETLPAHLNNSKYKTQNNLCFLSPTSISENTQNRLRWILDLLIATRDRPPHFACHGMHEWTMVYRGENIRHPSIAPLRLPQNEIDLLMESRPIACTHHDAFRFFASAAKPLNRIQPSLHTRHIHEQPACVHANMDLYKWAAKSMPWIGSEILLKTFLLASKLRDLDMRASPYNLSAWSLIPIKIETQQGRSEYETIQRQLALTASTLRDELIASLKIITSNTLPSQLLTQSSIK